MLAMCSVMELGASGLAGTPVVLPPSALPTSSQRGMRPAAAPPAPPVELGAPAVPGAPPSGTAAAAVSTGVRIDQVREPARPPAPRRPPSQSPLLRAAGRL